MPIRPRRTLTRNRNGTTVHEAHLRFPRPPHLPRGRPRGALATVLVDSRTITDVDVSRAGSDDERLLRCRVRCLVLLRPGCRRRRLDVLASSPNRRASFLVTSARFCSL